MPWIHVVAATLLVFGTVALFAFLKVAEGIEAEEAARAQAPSSVTPLRWPPPPAIAARPRHAPRAALDPADAGTTWHRAA